MDVMRCRQCAGTVVYDATAEHARCLFCASVALEPRDLAEPLAEPDGCLPFVVERARADAAFRTWARSSWWYPRVLRDLAVQLQPMWLPGWRFDADVESHWAGLEPAATTSGSRPVSGNDLARCRALVPASLGLRTDELEALAPFEEAAAIPWSADLARYPWEPPAWSRAAAFDQARQLFVRQRRRTLARRHGLTRCRVTLLISDEDTRLLMLPIWIGSFSYRGRPWRFVINGSNGKVSAKAPLDRTKIALVVLAILAAVAAALLLFGPRPEPSPDAVSLDSSSYSSKRGSNASLRLPLPSNTAYSPPG